MMQTLTIADVADVNPRISSELSSEPEREVNFVPMSHLSEAGSILVNGTRTLNEVSKGYTYFANGDVLVAKITPCMENGKAAYVDSLPTGIGFGSTEFHVLRPKAGVDGRYLFYMVWNPIFRQEASRNMTGSAGQKRVPTSFFGRFTIPLPPLSEQRRIADILDKADAVRRKRREAYRDYEDLRLSLFYSVFGRRFLEGSDVVQLGDLVDRERGISYGVVQRGFDDPKGVPVARISNIAANCFDGTDYVRVRQSISDQYRRTLLRGGEVLVSIRGTVGRVAIAPESATGWNVSREVAVIPLLDDVSAVFVKQLMLTDEAQRFITGNVRGVAQRGINLRDLRELPVPAPVSSNVQELLRRYGVLSDLTRRWRTACRDSSEVFQSLVQRAFRGEL